MKRETENTEKYILYIETCNEKREKNNSNKNYQQKAIK